MTDDKFRESMNECFGVESGEGTSIELRNEEIADLSSIQESVFNMGSSLARKHASNLRDWVENNNIDEETRCKITPQIVFGFLHGAGEALPELGVEILEKEGKHVH